MTQTALELSSPTLPAELPLTPDDALNLADFGVIEMDHHGRVLRYNATESHASGLAVDQVVGRHFFTEVATCCNNRKVANRFNEPVLDETIAYTFALRMKLTPVTLRMIKAKGSGTMYLLVRRS